MNGRKAFRSTVEDAGARTETMTEIRGAPYAWRDREFLQVRGALTFDGRGGLTGFRLVWGLTSASPASGRADSPFAMENHRAPPLRQQISRAATA